MVGACNPPSDPGRVPISPRFLRHAPVLFVDFPAALGLRQIYSTFARGVLTLVPPLRGYADALTEAMCKVYEASAARFSPDQHAHYVYSPRELTRWSRALAQAMTERRLEDLAAAAASSTSGGAAPSAVALSAIAAAASKPVVSDVGSLVRLWAHEGERLFADRLVDLEDRRWTEQLIADIGRQEFGGGGGAASPSAAVVDKALRRPLLFSDWLTGRYESVDLAALREYVDARLKTFYEEELDVPVVLFDEVLEHALR